MLFEKKNVVQQISLSTDFCPQETWFDELGVAKNSASPTLEFWSHLHASEFISTAVVVEFG